MHLRQRQTPAAATILTRPSNVVDNVLDVSAALQSGGLHVPLLSDGVTLSPAIVICCPTTSFPVCDRSSLVNSRLMCPVT